MSGFRAALRSMIGVVVQLGEDPGLLLEHLVGDLESILPKLDQQLQWQAMTIRLLEREVDDADAEVAALLGRVRGALADDRRDVAVALAERVGALRAARATAAVQLEATRRGYELSLELKRDCLRRLQDRCRQVAATLPPPEEARWRSRVSGLVARLAKAHVDGDLAGQIRDLEAAVVAPPAPTPGAGDYAADAARLAHHPVLDEVAP